MESRSQTNLLHSICANKAPIYIMVKFVVDGEFSVIGDATTSFMGFMCTHLVYCVMWTYICLGVWKQYNGNTTSYILCKQCCQKG